MVEATHVTREGRITHGCTGLYNEHNEASMQEGGATPAGGCRKSPIGIQIGHAGRKASSQVPWQGRDYLRPDQSPWPTVAPSALAVRRRLACAPMNLTATGNRRARRRVRRFGRKSKTHRLRRARAAFGARLSAAPVPVAAFQPAQRRVRHASACKFPLEVARAVREVWPKRKGARRAHQRQRLARRRPRAGRRGGLRARARARRLRLRLRVERRTRRRTRSSTSGPAIRCPSPTR